MGLFSLFLIVFSSQKIMTRFKIREWFFTQFYADIHFLYLIRNLRYKEIGNNETQMYIYRLLVHNLCSLLIIGMQLCSL